MPGLRETLDRWVYTSLGADALALAGRYPWLYAVVLGVLAALVVAIMWWGRRRLERLREDVRVTLALALTAEGRRCLAAARAIRRGALRLRHSIRREIDDRSERRALLAHLDRFTRSELRSVLTHALHLIRTADDRREHRLRGELSWQQEAWAAANDDAERDRLQQAIARTRQQLATVAPVNEARTRHVQALAEAAEAVDSLEAELSALAQSRRQALPAFRNHLRQAAGRMTDLREAYQLLEDPP